MIYWVSPLRRPRRSCGSITGLQAATLALMTAFMLTLVLAGYPLPLVAGVAFTLLTMVRAIPLPRLGPPGLPGSQAHGGLW